MHPQTIFEPIRAHVKLVVANAIGSISLSVADTNAYADVGVRGRSKKARKFRRRIVCLINSTDPEALILPPAAKYREFTSTENKYTESGRSATLGLLNIT